MEGRTGSKGSGPDGGGPAGHRSRLRELYRRHVRGGGPPVEMTAVRAAVERIAEATFEGWTLIAGLDHLALAEAGRPEDFEELEFLVGRGLSELNGVKNAVSLARRLA